MDGQLNKCPICDAAGIELNREALRSRSAVHCPRCGEYVITDAATMLISGIERGEDPLIRKRIARYLYEKRGSGTVLITSHPSHPEVQPEGYVVLHPESAKRLYADDGSPLEKYKRTLVNLKRATKGFGQCFNSEEDRWLLATMDDEEADAIIAQLFEEGHVTGSRAWDYDEFSLTAKGFKYAEELEAGAAVAPWPKQSPAGRGSKVFLSHSHRDKAFAERLATDLHARGISVWYDGWDLDIGHDLTVKIQEGIEESDSLAVVLSPAAVQSAWVEKEWTTALNRELAERRVVVLPILYRDCELPPFLQGKVYADFRKRGEYEQRLADLVRRLRGESKRPRKATEGE